MELLLNEKEEDKSAGHRWKQIIRGFVLTVVSLLSLLLILKTSFKWQFVQVNREIAQDANISAQPANVSAQPSNLSAPRSQDKITFPGEISISYLRREDHARSSKFRCTGSENDIGAMDARLCVFSNICYRRDSQRFYYFRLPNSEKKPLFYDASKGMLYQFSDNNDAAGFLSLSSGGGTSWAPIVANESYPTKNVTVLRHLHSLMQNRFADSNIAHGLWEDLGSISYSMERMNVFDRNLVIMQLDKISDTPLFRTYIQYVIPALSEHPMVDLHTYARSFNTDYVCFDSLIAGGQLNVFPRALIRENHGREALFYNWRSKILQYNGFDPKFVPSAHHIIITDKSQSIWTHAGSKRHRAIVNVEEVAKFIRLTYPNISSEVVQWHTIPFQEQLEKLMNTTILITPCGGVSLIIPFLPHGAHAIVMDYYVNIAAHGYSAGQSGSMEGALLNHIAHVRKQYYQLYGAQDYEFDYPGASDAREGASVIVNTTRLRTLIDKALEEMEA